MKKTSPLLTPTPSQLSIRGPRCSWYEGYSLHADLQVDQDDRKKLERLLRYGLRPPFAKKRLSLTASGQVRLKLRKPYYTGQTQLVLSPLDFLRRLAATIPPRRMNMVRFHGVFAPHAELAAARCVTSHISKTRAVIAQILSHLTRWHK